MWEYQRSDRSTLLFVTLIIASFVLMTLDVRAAGEGVTGTLRDGTQAVVSPAQAAVSSVTGPIADVVDGLANVAGLRSENQRLRSEIEQLRAEIDRLEDLQAENAELRAVLNLQLPEELRASTVTAQVIALSPSDFDYSMTIDRGLDHGVAMDMPVVDELGLVGRVVAVTGSSARVSLIIDPQQRVAVRAAENRDLGVIEGRGSGPLALTIFEASAPLMEESHIVTAGSDFFPPGLPVGQVVETARPEAGFVLRSTVDPAVQFNRLDYVRIIQWSSELVEDVNGDEDTTQETTTTTTP